MVNVTLSRTVRSVLAASALSSVFFALPSWAAQSATESTNNSDQTAQLKAVSVVGTRIKRTDISTAQPITSISATQIQQSGLTTLGQVLQQLTSTGEALNQTTNNAGNTNTINSPNGGAGEQQVSLRYLGSQRTLVLVNGKRWVTDFGGAVDLNSIPLAAIDHIEVLQDGASAIYGSDAIGGVVDVILKKDFNGATASAYYGKYFEGGHHDGMVQKYSFTVGSDGSKYGVFLAGEYDTSNPIFASARAVTATSLIGRGSSGTPQGRFEFLTPPTSEFQANGGSLPAADNVLLSMCPPTSGGMLKCNLTLKGGASGTSPSDFRPYENSDSFNTAPQNYLLTPLDTKSAYVHAHYNFNNNIAYTTSIAYVDRDSKQLNAPMPLFFSANNIDDTIAATNPYNPFGFALNPNSNLILLARRSIEMGPRSYDTNTTSLRFDGAFNGTVQIGNGEWDWDAGYIYGQSREHDIFSGHFNLANLSQAVGDGTACLASNNGCVPYNLFGGIPSVTNPTTFVFPPAPFPGSITPAMNSFVGATEQNTVVNSLQNLNADISNPDVLELPGGSLGVAAGYEHRQISGTFTPDALLAAGDSTSSPGVRVPAAAGEISVNAVYAEVNVPVLSKLPMAYDLNVDVADRYSKYDLFGSNTSGRIGVKWQPIHDLLIRGTVSSGFRAPSLNDLYGGKFHNFSFSGTDPCVQWGTSNVPQNVKQICQSQGAPPDLQAGNGAQTVVITGSNPNLKPETSLSRTIGFVYSPSFAPGLNVNADYYKIDIKNTIQALDPNTIVQGCYFGGSAHDCSFLQRDIFGALTINATSENIGALNTNGIDGGIDYAFGLGNLGQLKLGFNATYVKFYDETEPNGLGGAITRQLVGTLVGGTTFPDAIPRYRASFSADWTYGNWVVHWDMQYIDSMVTKCSDYLDGTPDSLTNLGFCTNPDTSDNALSTTTLGKTTYNNVLATYNFDSINTSISLGVRNIFDKQPPSIGGSGFDTNVYQIPGRFIYSQISVKF